jgi:SAM-dependent methyltransferase
MAFEDWIISKLRFHGGRIPSPGARISELLGRAGANDGFLGPTQPILPSGATEYLRTSNQRLRELKREYRTFLNQRFEPGLWTDTFVSRDVPLDTFRGDCAFVWQWRELNLPVNYLLTAYYLKNVGGEHYLNILTEDELFGVYTVVMQKRALLSRDLLDSVLEMMFMERCCGLSSGKLSRILDIGSGYGRLAHRIISSCGTVNQVLCVDAIPEAAFICEYYLHFRGVDHRAQVAPLPTIEIAIADARPQLALSIHCFDECSANATKWWLELLKRNSVEYLMVVPSANACQGDAILGKEADGSRRDFLPLILKSGYCLMAREPKYCDPALQTFGISPTEYFMFRRT